MKKKFLRILNRYSLLYLPTGWVIGLAIIFIAYEPITVLYFLSLFVFSRHFVSVERLKNDFLFRRFKIVVVPKLPSCNDFLHVRSSVWCRKSEEG